MLKSSHMIFETNLVLPWEMKRVFTALNAPSMMQKVAFPLVIFRPIEPTTFPEQWKNGATYRMNMYFFGFLPLGWQQLTIRSTSSETAATLSDVGPGFAVKMWNHRVQLTKKGTACIYEETLELSAGILAPVIWIGMKALFVWRKYRWLQITRT